MSEFDNNPFLLFQQGWQCPVCKRVYSPSTSMCRYCGDKETTINTGNHLIMRDFTEEEQEEYNKVLDKLYEPTGLNIFELAEKNNLNRIKRFNKEQMTEFILDLVNEQYPCEYCGFYKGTTEDCGDKDCEDGIKQWLESEVE